MRKIIQIDGLSMIVQKLLSAAILLVIPQQVFAAPNDFDGDSKSDFAVARRNFLGNAANPCNVVLAASWANCASNIRLDYTNFFIKSSDSGATEIVSLVTNEDKTLRWPVRDLSTTELDENGMAVPVIINFDSSETILNESETRVNVASVSRFEGKYFATRSSSDGKYPIFSSKDLLEHFYPSSSWSTARVVAVDNIVLKGITRKVHILETNGADSKRKLVFNVVGANEPLEINEMTLEYGLPVVADYSGDGNDEIAVFTNDGNWIIRDLESRTTQTIQWGLSGDHPMPGDYDGDGVSDLAVFRPSTAMWYILNSRSGYDKDTAKVVQFGLPPYLVKLENNQNVLLKDYPIKGDFDGDGRLDIAIYRMSNGSWYFIGSSTNQINSVQWGLPFDTPVGLGIYDRVDDTL